MTQESLEEAQKLQEKITELEEELARGGQINNALAAGD